MHLSFTSGHLEKMASSLNFFAWPMSFLERQDCEAHLCQILCQFHHLNDFYEIRCTTTGARDNSSGLYLVPAVEVCFQVLGEISTLADTAINIIMIPADIEIGDELLCEMSLTVVQYAISYCVLCILSLLCLDFIDIYSLLILISIVCIFVFSLLQTSLSRRK